MPATRGLTSAFKQDARRPFGAGQVRLWFLTLQEADSLSSSYDFEGEDASITTGSIGTLPIRLVCEDGGFVYSADGLPVNYKLNEGGGYNLYTALPFTIEVPTDDEGVPRGRLVVPNIDPAIGNLARSLKKSPRLTIKLFLLSDFTTSPLDGDNARPSIGIPTPVATLDWLKITRATITKREVTAEIGSYDLAREPWPYMRTTPDRVRGLEWGA